MVRCQISENEERLREERKFNWLTAMLGVLVFVLLTLMAVLLYIHCSRIRSLKK